jgi:aldehyde dehydrogenase (NAD+)
MVASGLAQGATLAYGGTRPKDPAVGYNPRPAIFTDVTNDMAIACDEIFGPVPAIIGYDIEADALRLANGSSYGLGGSVYADDPEQALHLTAQLPSGTCAINDAPLPLAADRSGGTRQAILAATPARKGCTGTFRRNRLRYRRAGRLRKAAQGTNTMSSGCE